MMKTVTRVIGFFMVSLAMAGGCSCEPTRKLPEPRPPVLTDTHLCAAACEHIKDCDEGKPLPDGTTCEQLCTHLQDNGVWLQPACVMQVKSCAEIEQCELKKR